MAEVVGLVAAGAQLFQQTSKVISMIKDLGSEIRHEMGSAAWQLSHADVLLGLAQKIQQDSSPLFKQHVECCLEELNIIHSKLAEINAGSRQGLVNRRRMAVKLKTKERDIVEAWKRIEEKTRALSLALQWENYVAVDGISKHLIPNELASQDIPVTQSTQTIHAAHPVEMTSLTNFNRVYNIELNKTHNFVGRDALLAKLSSKLGLLGTQIRVALYGLGGIGQGTLFLEKSRLAYEYARRTNEGFPETWIFWIQANTKLQFLEDYLGMASCLKLTGTGDSPPVIEDVSRCLKNNNFGNWVMIVDNVDDGAILDGEKPLVDLIPVSAKSSVIFTTRSRRIAARLTYADNIIPVDDLNPNEARDLFCHNLGLKHHELCETDQVSVAEFLRSLNYLPLAICQAGSFISGQQITISGYLEIFNASEDTKAFLLDDESFPQGPVRARPVLLTLAISLDHIFKSDKQAADLLSFVACLAAQNIPRLLLPTANDPDCMVKLSFLKALGLLREYCLITADNGNQTFDMHAVVHLATRRWLRSRSEFNCWTQKAFLSVFECFPSAPSHESNNLFSCARYLPHAEAVLGHKEFPPEYDIQRCWLAHRCSQYLQITGRYDHAEWFSTLSADLSATAFGEDSPDHFTMQEDHATVIRQIGKFAAAVSIDRVVLDKRQRILGEHRDTFSSMNNLGLSLDGLGQYSEAEYLHRLALDGRQKKLGEEDAHTLASMQNLSLSLEKQRKYSEAEGLARRAVLLKRKIRGREHLSTLLSVSALAICLQRQEKFDEAQELYAEVLRSRERQLGKHHPRTLNAKLGLIGILASQGQYERTEKMARDHLALTTEFLGPHHHQTLLMAHNLGFILLKLGKSEEAERFARAAFMGRKKVLAAKHIDTKASEELLDAVLDLIKEDGARTERKARLFSNLTRPNLSDSLLRREGSECGNNENTVE